MKPASTPSTRTTAERELCGPRARCRRRRCAGCRRGRAVLRRIRYVRAPIDQCGCQVNVFRPGLQVRPELVDRRRRAERPRHLEVHLRRLVQREADLGRLAQLVAVRGDRRAGARCRPGTASGLRLRARMFSQPRGASGRSGAARWRATREAVDEADPVVAVPDARCCRAGRSSGSRGSGGARASTIQPSDAAVRVAPAGRRPCSGLRQRRLDPQPLLRRREVARRDRQVRRGGGRDDGESEDEQGEAAHRSPIVVAKPDG